MPRIPSGLPERKYAGVSLPPSKTVFLPLALSGMALSRWAASGLAGRVSGAERLLSWGWDCYLNCLYLKQDLPCLGPNSPGLGWAAPMNFGEDSSHWRACVRMGIILRLVLSRRSYLEIGAGKGLRPV